eukprot:scaffold38162_cov272-Skeletonema_dohrnii-CCMP3373.AAC.1
MSSVLVRVKPYPKKTAALDRYCSSTYTGLYARGEDLQISMARAVLAEQARQSSYSSLFRMGEYCSCFVR